MSKLARSAVGKLVNAAMDDVDKHTDGQAGIDDYLAKVIEYLNDELPEHAKVFVYDDELT